MNAKSVWSGLLMAMILECSVHAQSPPFPVRELPLLTSHVLAGTTEEDARIAETTRRETALKEREESLLEREQELQKMQEQLNAFRAKLLAYREYLNGLYQTLNPESQTVLPSVETEKVEKPIEIPTTQPVEKVTQAATPITQRTYSRSRCRSGTCSNTGW
ncbi:MAG: hypothetical protein PHE53_12405 [Thermoguttaceae bacterium]|nr:hypothetical protein [Thermoguttaceae bacterium]